MANEPGQSLPFFQPYATAQGFLSEQEMERLIAEHLSLLAEGKLGPGNANPDIRRSKVVMLDAQPKYDWLYDRIWAAAQECNRQFFGVDVAGVEANIQLGRYDSLDRGFYDLHTDFARSGE